MLLSSLSSLPSKDLHRLKYLLTKSGEVGNIFQTEVSYRQVVSSVSVSRMKFPIKIIHWRQRGADMFVFDAINPLATQPLIFKADISRSYYRQERNYDFDWVSCQIFFIQKQ